MLRIALVIGLGLSLFPALGCKKAGEVRGELDRDPAVPAKPVATASSGTVGSDGVRTIAIEANKAGYTPDKIPGKPGEKLKLVFTRTFDSECIGELKTPDGKLVVLPMNKPVEVAVTVPADGEVRFACGMDMFHGVVVADKPPAKS